MVLGRLSEERVMSKVVGMGSRKGSTPFGRAGDIIQHPPVWTGVAAVLALFGPKGRRAGLRGAACYLVAAAAHLPLKAAGPSTSSFPSGTPRATWRSLSGRHRSCRRYSCLCSAPPWPFTGRSSASAVTTRATWWSAERWASSSPWQYGSCGPLGAGGPSPVRGSRRHSRRHSVRN